ncbi:hypothetical protein GLOTRDRAFT_96877 [Gloeophyllum trabeum ATCC 11539]|uniref:Cytochrome P450 n=1 Tax=Gloeophyllum trabeum (strain ATCC 11539 / FP-39264 / Madison 617) TaxID=670483 RepID=S7R8G5_GLOTA|nr:uncharacterized protein GLOTRDRAFT_96877 [Gloeophyllum trabeum ATCC 11539]EPQ50610.1 hypothetical protein GLOTRDRAFT_96877 [Gloeophyllum trabeum ATCC 11539]
MWTPLLSAGLVVSVTWCSLRCISARKNVSYLPGMISVVAPTCALGGLLPKTFWDPRIDWHWKWRYTSTKNAALADYKYYKSQTIFCISLVSGPTHVHLVSACRKADPEREAGGVQTIRDERRAEVGFCSRALWGGNIVSSEHEVDKRHRRIAGPAFTGSTYALVVEETCKVTTRWSKANNGPRPSTDVRAIDHVTGKFALGIISRCGFGLPFPWSDPSSSEGGGSDGEKLATPRWVLSLPLNKLRSIEEAFVRSFIATKKAELGALAGYQKPKQDLLMRLMAASEAEGKNGLSDQELLRLALLSVSQDEQDKAGKHIMDVLGPDRDPVGRGPGVFRGSLAHGQNVSAVVFRTGSVHYAGQIETVVLSMPEEDGGGDLAIGPGVRLVVDFVGWLCFLALFLRDWRVDPVLREETAEAWRGSRDWHLGSVRCPYGLPGGGRCKFEKDRGNDWPKADEAKISRIDNDGEPRSNPVTQDRLSRETDEISKMIAQMWSVG